MVSRPLQLTIIIALLSSSITGCSPKHHSADPYGAFNRRNFQFNQSIKAPFQAKQCQPAEPKKPNIGTLAIRNFFGNLGEFNNMANDLLQLDLKAFITHFGRLAINTTVGIGGLFDAASDLGLEDKENDFSLTIAYYQHKLQDNSTAHIANQTEYFVLPFKGSITSRELVAAPVNYVLNPFFFIDIGPIKYARIPLKIISSEDTPSPCASDGDAYKIERQHYLNQRSRIITEHLEAR